MGFFTIKLRSIPSGCLHPGQGNGIILGFDWVGLVCDETKNQPLFQSYQ